MQAVDIAQSPLRLEPVSATFHGRDIFAPVAAQLAAGFPLAEAGLPIDPDGLVALELSRASMRPDGVIDAHVLYRDRFGNLGLDLSHDDLPGSGLRIGQGVRLRVRGESETARFVRTFAEALPGELIVYEDAYRRVAVAVSHGDGGQRLGLAPGRRAADRAGVRLGQPRLHLRATGSTNDEARGLAARGAPHGTLVTATQQTAGRGRQGRAWAAPAGRALLCSLVLRDPGELISLAAGVAVAELAGAQAATEVAQRCARGRAQGRRHPRRGPSPGRVGGARDRHQRGPALAGLSPRVARTSGDARARGRRHRARAGHAAARPRALAERSLRRRARRRAGSRRAARASGALGGGSGVGAGIDDHGRLRVRTAIDTVALDAGEVHLGDAPGA